MKEIYSHKNVNDLFKQIDQLCSLPFARLEPLETTSNIVKQPKLTEITCQNESSFKSSDIKTVSQVEELFRDIKKLCTSNLQFRINDLDTEDRIDTKKLVEPKVVEKSQSKLRPTRSSARITKNSSPVYSFANLLFNNFEKKSELMSVTNEKLKNKQPRKTRTPINAKRKDVEEPKEKSLNSISKVNLNSSNLMTNVLSIRNYLSTLKADNKKNINEENANKRKTNKSKQTKRKSGILSKEDSIESGYSSSQSSISSPMSSCLTTDVDETNGSSISSNKSTISESSYISSINPNGGTVYLRSQYDIYLDKFPKRKKKNHNQYNICKNVDHHQKVIEWQTKTINANICPTPNRESFTETPPISPCTNELIQNDSNNDDLLDLDCFEDFCDNSQSRIEPQVDELDLLLMQMQTYPEFEQM